MSLQSETLALSSLADPDRLVKIEPLPFIIGRCRTCHLQIDDEHISDHHACIIQRGQHYVLYDLCSRNGTFIVKTTEVGQPPELVRVEATTDPEKASDNQAGGFSLKAGARIAFAGSIWDCVACNAREPEPEPCETPPEPRAVEPAPTAPIATPVMLEIIKGGECGRELEVPRLPFVIGRSSTKAELPLPDFPLVSGMHIRLFRNNAGRLMIEDLGSRNGTFLNGKRIKGAHPIVTGDIIDLAHEISFRVHSDADKSKRFRIQRYGHAAIVVLAFLVLARLVINKGQPPPTIRSDSPPQSPTHLDPQPPPPSPAPSLTPLELLKQSVADSLNHVRKGDLNQAERIAQRWQEGLWEEADELKQIISNLLECDQHLKTAFINSIEDAEVWREHLIKKVLTPTSRLAVDKRQACEIALQHILDEWSKRVIEEASNEPVALERLRRIRIGLALTPDNKLLQEALRTLKESAEPEIKKRLYEATEDQLRGFTTRAQEKYQEICTLCLDVEADWNWTKPLHDRAAGQLYR